MGKHNGYTSKNKTDTKILFKKSNITIRTHSRTCSDASQITKSGVLHIKKNLSKCNDYYTDGNVIKRDLSVETGVCILRRYYKSKHKRDRCSKPTSLVKSKCSTVADTEFAEFKPELACGDSTNKFEIIDQANALNIDITSLMVENLKSLLNEWIRKHVLEDTQTKKKLISVLDSILQSLGSKVSEVRSSCSTYVIERNGTGCRVRDRKTATTAVTCQYCNKKLTSVITDASSSIIFKRFSRFTIPFPYKHVRIISTLSIPRNMNKKYKNKEKHMVYKVKKQKKQAPPMNAKKDRKIVINVSSCGMSTCSKKSWEHVPKGSEKKPPSKKRGIIFLPQMFYKSATDCTSTTEIEGVKKNVVTHENNLDTMPSLVKSIFADDPANVTSTDQVVNDNRKDNFTTTSLPRLSSEKLMNCVSNLQHHEAKYEFCKESTPINVNQTYKSHTKIDFVNQSIEFPNITIHEQNSVTKQFTRESYFAKPKFRKKVSRKRKPLQKTSRKHSSKYDYESIKFKQFSYLYKKFKKTRKKDEIFSHFRNIFEYFANYDSNKDIKLEIHCNVYPFFDIEEKYSNSNLIINDTKVYPEYEVKTIPSAAHTIVHAIATTDSDLKERKNLNAIQTQPIQKPEIIALLDGAASQAKYIFKSDNSTSTSNNSLKCLDSTEKGTTMTGLEVSKELSELKSAINDLSATAQKIVLEHKKRQNEKNKNEVNSSSEQKATLIESGKRVVKNANVSKGIQFSNFTKPAPKVQLLSGIKLSKEPKKTEDSLNRLKKKSSSYHIIDSESILKVTDMTAFPDKSIESNKAKPEKSKSLLQITDEKNKQKLIAFINKEARRVEKNKNDQMVFTMCPTSSSCYTPRLPPCMDYPHAMTCPYKSRSNKASQLTLPVNLSHFQGCNHTYCSSVYDIAKTNPTITVKRRSSIRFWEGLLYCILLWIPLIVIIYFFSAHIHELRKGLASNKTDKTSTKTTKKNDTSSRLLLQLADFEKYINMQTLKESFKENQKKTNRRPTSSMRYPKQMPSYIVAFAVHETYDDIATAQQMICNKRSIQGSTSSVSPALSSKTITLEHSAPKILDTEVIETSSEVKINVDEVIDKNEDTNEIETPSEVKSSINEIFDKNEDINDNSNNEPPETKDYIVVDNREEEDMNRDDNIIVIESKHIKKPANRLLKKKHQNNCRIMNVNFKYKKTLKRVKKASKTPACAAKFKETFYSDSVSKVVSRTSLLKTVAAKENILEAVDSIFSDEDNNNDESIHSSPSTAKKSFISYSSDDTLTGKGSISSKNEDLSSLGTINSVIKIPPPIVTPYKTEVINVSVAVAYNPSSNDNAQDNLSAEPYRSIFDRDLLSTETLVRPALLLTSDSGSSSAASENVPNAYMEGISIKNSSDGTLKPIINSENTFVVGNTSSEADDSMPSESTLTPNSEKFMYSENLRQTPPAIDNQEKERTHYNRAALLDTVINMGIFPKTNPSTSSAINYNDDLNNVFVTGDSDKYLKNAKYNDDQFIENPKDCTKLEFLNALKKSFDAYKETNILRNVNLPNESDIKAIINETDKFEVKFGTGELGNYPGNLAELWDRLVLVIDSSIRRLEQSLVEKIVTEIKKSLPIFEKQATGIKEEIFDMEKMQGEGDTVISNKELGEKEEIQKEIDESLQCNLVGNQVIDDIMIKFSVEDPKAAISGVVTKSFPKVKRPKIFRDYFEVLKPPNVESSLVDGKGDTVTVSTVSPSEIEEVASAQRVKSFLSGPMTFLWENMIVLTSVPSFLVMLLCIYGLIVLLMKPW